MKHIDKNDSANKSRGDKVVEDFIANQKSLGKDCSYYLFGKTIYKNQLRSILIDEQDEYCCYCMRTIKNDETTTIEHVIPKGCSLDQLNTYKNLYGDCFTEVIHLNNFSHSCNTPPYPHSIAYQNLIASCKGILNENKQTSYCCNNKRGNDNIKPIMFDEKLENISYLKYSGEMYSSDMEIKNTISTLGLNNETLKEIRRIWAKATEKGINIDDRLSGRELAHLIFGTYSISLIGEDKLRKYFKNEYYRKLFLEYKWFGVYFA